MTEHVLQLGLLTDADVFAGTERHMLELACALRSHGCNPTVICPKQGILAQRAATDRIPVVPVPARLPGAIWEIRRHLRQGTFDLIHTHNGRTSLIATVAACLAGRGAVISTQHFIEPSRLRRRGIKAWVSNWVHRWVERRTARIIAISVAVRDAMLRRGDATGHKIVVVPNGIGLPNVQSAAAPQQLRSALGLSSDSFMMACIARLEAEKDVRTLVDAMAIVVRREPTAICLHAGDGSQQELIGRQIAELGLEKNVRLLGFRNDVNEIMNACDLFVLPSPAEGFGLVILEAMALGKPVVATAAGGPLEIVVPGETGLLVPPSSPPALAEAILAMAADAHLRQRMGRAGRERFLNRFTADRMAADTVAVYGSVLANARTPRPVVTAPAPTGKDVPLEAAHGGD